MLTDPTEIEIIKSAKQKNVRHPGRSRQHFINIFDAFFTTKTLRNKAVIDLGPGQYDLAELLREFGSRCLGIDNDPAVLELGRYKNRNIEVREGDLKNIDLSDLAGQWDGLFCKFSINSGWFADHSDAHRRHIKDLVGTLKPDGWGWIAPWNGIPATPKPHTAHREALRIQRQEFKRYGFDCIELTDAQSRKYGVHGKCMNRALFIRGLRCPWFHKRG